MKQVVIYVVTVLFLANSSCYGNVRDTLRVLFVGNSYTYYNGLPDLVSLISDSTQTKLITQQSTAGGVSLSHHWKGLADLQTRELIKDGNFDVVVLQEQSLGTLFAKEAFMNFSEKFCQFIRENGAIPYFYVTWAREQTPQLQSTITEEYKKSAVENDAELVLAGDAWRLARRLRPSIKIYQNDGSHPNALGTFLTACVFVQELTGEVPSESGTEYLLNERNDEANTIMRQKKADIKFCLKVVRKIARNRSH